ncbi:RHS repeat-associated core domain-containing protein [Massilia solisilvae]|uniref:RHS repeat-associated core domain-containing protein n=1 Tax=Massilia solisilvae TaxID=1811225 RepID=A0ABT2BT96_9BURK|nr:RHS repeat-associated core domain-containing protein [Massilia solisilvae]MCS0611088.1 RHS repeat-associated core domain-containing protein [Massilia solisilvae]
MICTIREPKGSQIPTDDKAVHPLPSGACQRTGGTADRQLRHRHHVIAEARGNSVQYDHTDGLGSPIAYTYSAGRLLNRTRYEPYGATAAGMTPAIAYTGHVNAPELGLVYMQQRYYDPIAARFISNDPVLTDTDGGNGVNRFAYAKNNPYSYLDPNGRNAVLAAAFATGTVLVLAAYEYASDPKARAAINKAITNAIRSEQNDTPKSAPKAEDSNRKTDSNSSAPSVPSGLVGVQDNKSRQRGNQHVSVPLDPSKGGTGDANKDFDHLTGGSSKPRLREVVTHQEL